MEKQKIKSITEAFSMQPESFGIMTKENMEHFYDKENALKEIKEEVLDKDTNVYVGCNFKGKKLFQYLVNSVNVHYC